MGHMGRGSESNGDVLFLDLGGVFNGFLQLYLFYNYSSYFIFYALFSMCLSFTTNKGLK